MLRCQVMQRPVASETQQLAVVEENTTAAATEVDGDVPETTFLFLYYQFLPAAWTVAFHSIIDRVSLLERAGATDNARRIPSGSGRHHDFGITKVAFALEGG